MDLPPEREEVHHNGEVVGAVVAGEGLAPLFHPFLQCLPGDPLGRRFLFPVLSDVYHISYRANSILRLSFSLFL